MMAMIRKLVCRTPTLPANDFDYQTFQRAHVLKFVCSNFMPPSLCPLVLADAGDEELLFFDCLLNADEHMRAFGIEDVTRKLTASLTDGARDIGDGFSYSTRVFGPRLQGLFLR